MLLFRVFFFRVRVIPCCHKNLLGLLTLLELRTFIPVMPWLLALITGELLVICFLLIFCIRYGVEQNGSCLVMIIEGLLLVISHLASGDSFSFSILGMLIAFNDDIPEIYIKAKKKTFYSVLPVVKFLTIKDGRFCTV